MNHIDKDNTDIYIIIARYFMGNATPDDIDTLRKWIEQSPENKKLFFEQQDLWEALNPSFEVTESDIEKAERKVIAKAGIMPRGTGLIRKFFVFWSRIAAVAILPLLVATMYFIFRPDNAGLKNVTLSTDYGCTSKATLPDGSVVWLNANSDLEYSQDMRGDSRDVNLHGEAYFDVHADAVDSENMVSLLPGEHLVIKDGRRIISKNVDLNKYCSWRNGILIFEDEPIHNICRRLQQIYNVEFEIDPSLTNRTFRFILKGESISDIMNLFQLTAPVACITTDSDASESDSLHQRIRIIPL